MTTIRTSLTILVLTALGTFVAPLTTATATVTPTASTCVALCVNTAGFGGNI